MMSRIARYVFGVATVASGVVTLLWPSHVTAEAGRFAAALAEIAGGAALLFDRSVKLGAAVLVAVYLIFALACVPRIIAAPQIYNTWGNFFEPFSLAVGAGVVYARQAAWISARVGCIARLLFGICVTSFALEQLFYLTQTAQLVPAWIPPGPTFWAFATTGAFALAALALFVNWPAVLAARLLTIMLAVFGLAVWLPSIVLNSRSHTNWSEGAETAAIAGAACILAAFLRDVEKEHA
jgi:hypothetical protein